MVVRRNIATSGSKRCVTIIVRVHEYVTILQTHLRVESALAVSESSKPAGKLLFSFKMANVSSQQLFALIVTVSWMGAEDRDVLSICNT